MTIREKSPRLTLYWSAIYPILVSNIPYIGQQYTLYWFAIYPILLCGSIVNGLLADSNGKVEAVSRLCCEGLQGFNNYPVALSGDSK